MRRAPLIGLLQLALHQTPPRGYVAVLAARPQGAYRAQKE